MAFWCAWDENWPGYFHREIRALKTKDFDALVDLGAAIQ
jgi:hypothetical protein